MILIAMPVLSLTLALILSVCAPQVSTPVQVTAASQSAGILKRDRAGSVMPATVFFRGQTSTIQARNSAGIQFADGKLMLSALVDTGGYSSALQQSYQAYLLTEVPLDFGGRHLAPGAYGYGFLGDHSAVVMDLGGNELFRTPTAFDAKIARPTPLQIFAAGDGSYRLYLGRDYVILKAAPQKQ